ncbi:MAG: NAD(+)--dinitrogen-reductase ADP-D-ribosyltransferase [Pseudomonadota bacterium]|nr:NAD(+)--dinitrogen-reductase ADP-D-ribosyltransferase [Pseudomonadota bacterium]MDP1903649.1 NAD(+)--dinitrogen-reductase ADP-D-ribosyltransferase [Pseudomonadota bacterium]MDP2352817.1 NAD(+)--dinitrogen-reductase ADP-D-ribosyltransferase [Pseudomonadota bacterium]
MISGLLVVFSISSRITPDLNQFRGVNRMGGYEELDVATANRNVVLLNNLNAFSRERERACDFGDSILEVRVPLPKVFFFHGLLPGKLRGEEEYAVIGGVYEMRVFLRECIRAPRLMRFAALTTSYGGYFIGRASSLLVAALSM